MVYDVAIIGAGLSGATLARLLDSGFKVLLVDKRHLQSAESYGPAKCCGGLIAPDAQKVLAELGLGIPEEVLVGPQLFVVRTIDLSQRIERFYQRFYINIDRDRFDRWLVSLIPNSVDTLFGTTFKGLEREGDLLRLKLVLEGKEVVHYARALVAADGANSLVRRQAFASQAAPKQYIAIQEWFETGRSLPYFTAIFDPAITDFYAWTIPKRDFMLLGAALEVGRDPYSKFNRLKEELTSYGLVLGNKVRQEGAFIYRPRSLSQICTGDDNIFLVGEAAGFISPSSAEGYSYAMRSAAILAESLNQGLSGCKHRYQRGTQHLRRNIRLKHFKSPAMYWPWLRRLVMSTGIASVRVNSIMPE